MSHWRGQEDLNKMMEELEHMGKEDLDKMISALHREWGQGHGVWREEDMSYMEDPIDIYRRHRSDRLKREGRRGGVSPDMWHTETYTSTTWGGEVTMENEVPASSALERIRRADKLYRAISGQTAQRTYSTDPHSIKLCRDHAEAVRFANDSCDERPNPDNPEWLLHYRRAFIKAQEVPLSAPVNSPQSGVEALRKQMDSVGETMESFGWPTGPHPRKQTPAPKPKPEPLSPREKYEREDERLRGKVEASRAKMELAVAAVDRGERNQRFFTLGCGIFMTALSVMAFSVSGVILTVIMAVLAGLFGIMTLGSIGAKDKNLEEKLITARNEARSAAERHSDFVLHNHPDTYKIEGSDDWK